MAKKQGTKNKLGAKPKPTPNREKTGRTPLDPTKPLGDKNPPIETQFQPGVSGNPRGRPRNLGQLKDFIQTLSSEPIESRPDVTRLEVMLRGMMTSKSSHDRKTVLEYGWGKVPLPITLAQMSDDELLKFLTGDAGETAGGGGAEGAGSAPTAGSAEPLNESDADAGSSGDVAD